MMAYDLTPSVAVKLVSEQRLVSQVTGSNFLLPPTLYKEMQAEAKRTISLPAISAAPAASAMAARPRDSDRYWDTLGQRGQFRHCHTSVDTFLLHSR